MGRKRFALLGPKMHTCNIPGVFSSVAQFIVCALLFRNVRYVWLISIDTQRPDAIIDQYKVNWIGHLSRKFS